MRPPCNEIRDFKIPLEKFMTRDSGKKSEKITLVTRKY
jgi:hypothetical protein